jgi:hypothetical protein
MTAEMCVDNRGQLRRVRQRYLKVGLILCEDDAVTLNILGADPVVSPEVKTFYLVGDRLDVPDSIEMHQTPISMGSSPTSGYAN